MNVQRKTKQTKGFTIIEVVLVLAIAGLIFLMVFIALPALQKSQRDSARKSEVGTVASAIQSYMSNNRNKLPSAANIADYVGVGSEADTLESGSKIVVAQTKFVSGTEPKATFSDENAAGANVGENQIKVFYGSKCASSNSTSNTLEKGTTKQAAVVVALESGGSNGSIYCQNN